MATDEGRVYDRYLRACREGNVESPDSFFARHPAAGEELRSRIALLHRHLTEKGALPFERLGGFRLLEALDEGGMGSVYLAEQEGLDRVVALKIIRPELAGSRQATLRFEREAQALAQLRHPHLVTVYGAGIDQGVRYLAMEVVPGRGLDDLIASDPVPWRRVVGWITKLARALAYAHSQGIVHRDVKPSNIRITPEDEPLLLDFGVAFDMGAEQTALTRTFAGSPTYAAPEQIDPRGGAADGRTDVYGLGVTLYQCLTGQVPFGGGTVERIFHRTLTEDPQPPRTTNRALPRDLDVVTLKAMEKEPARRYQTAEEFARDLDAIVTHRPIAARPPGSVRRVAKWSRRHPAWASAVALLLLVAFAATVRSLQSAAARRADARQLVARARDAIAGYRGRRAELIEFRREVRLLRARIFGRYTSADEDREFDRKERAVTSEKRLREETFHEVRALLVEAQRLDPDVRGVTDVLAELYFERWEEAWAEQNGEAVDFYRRLVEETAPGSAAAGAVAARSMLSVTTEPPGADVYVYRYEEPDERRLVPVPLRGGPTPAPPGAWALRVVRGAGDLAAGDHLLDVAGHPIEGTLFGVEANGNVWRFVTAGGRPVRGPMDVHEAVDEETTVERNGDVVALPDARRFEVLTPAQLAERGGVRARMEHRGAVREVTLPAGLILRTTAAPAFLVESAHGGRTPYRSDVESGRYLLVVVKPGYEIHRLALSIERSAESRIGPLRLNPAGATPSGWVFVPADVAAAGGFWMMEREVTCGEYLPFLNDPETLRRIDASATPILAPRGGGLGNRVSFWERGEDGRYTLPPPWRADWPAVGLSYEDALAYVAWKSERDGRAYALPTGGSAGDWDRAWYSFERRVYPFGDEFRPKFVCSCYSRHRPLIEPVLTYPIDESPVGVYDLCGSAREWLDGWFDEHRRMKSIGGGGWGQTLPAEFTTRPNGFAADTFSGELGFRMVFRREDPR